MREIWRIGDRRIQGVEGAQDGGTKKGSKS